MKRKTSKTKHTFKKITFGTNVIPYTGEDTQENRIELYNRFKVIYDKFIEHGCPDIESTPTKGSLYVGNRIGTPSVYGLVYELSFTDDPSITGIMKVLLYTNSQSYLDVDNEISISEAASQLVLDSICPYFPIIYGKAFCPDLHFPIPYKKGMDKYSTEDALRLFDAASIYATKRNLVQEFLIQNYDSDDMNEHLADQLLISEYKDLIPLQLGAYIQLKQPDTAPIFMPVVPMLIGSIMVMEREWGDLMQYIFSVENFDFNDFITILYEVFIAIRVLQTNLKRIHGDLHVGNILIRLVDHPNGKSSDSMRPMPLITDFGISQPFTHRNVQFNDVRMFLSTFSNFLLDNFTFKYWQHKKVIRNLQMELDYPSFSTMDAFIKKFSETYKSYIHVSHEKQIFEKRKRISSSIDALNPTLTSSIVNFI